MRLLTCLGVVLLSAAVLTGCSAGMTARPQMAGEWTVRLPATGGLYGMSGLQGGGARSDGVRLERTNTRVRPVRAPLLGVGYPAHPREEGPPELLRRGAFEPGLYATRELEPASVKASEYRGGDAIVVGTGLGVVLIVLAASLVILLLVLAIIGLSRLGRR